MLTAIWPRNSAKQSPYGLDKGNAALHTRGMTASAKVQSYNLTASNGRHIRTATQVIFSDGQVVRFMERMSKREALRQAAAQIGR